MGYPFAASSIIDNTRVSEPLSTGSWSPEAAQPYGAMAYAATETAALMAGMQKVPGVMGQGLRKTAELLGTGYQKMKMGQMLANGMMDGRKSVAIEQIVRKHLPLWSKQSAVTFGFGFVTGMWGSHVESAPVSAEFGLKRPGGAYANLALGRSG